VGVQVLTSAVGGNGLEWKMVCWIDSKVDDKFSLLLLNQVYSPRRFPQSVLFYMKYKAMFGDEQTHHSSVLPQAEAYVHRFGPGMILYWFGHAPLERLVDGNAQDVVIMSHGLPDTFKWPASEVVSK